MRSLRWASAPLVGVLMVTACGGGGDGEGAAQPDDAIDGGDGQQAAGCDTVTIGSLHPLTGPLAFDANQMDVAIKMAAEDLSGDGLAIDVLSADTQGQPEVGQTEAQRLIQEGANALVGAFQSAVTINLATVAQREQVPLVVDVAVADEITSADNDFVFRIQPSARDMGVFGARYLAEISEAKGEPVETVAYMHDESAFGSSVLEAFKAEAEELGMEVVIEIPYNPFEVQDVTTELQRVANADPDVLAVTGYYNDGILIAETAMSVQPPVNAIYGVADGAFDLPQFVEDAEEASNLIFDSNYHFDATSERVNELRSRFLDQEGEEMRTAAVLSYQAVEVIAQAARQAESCDPAALRDAIAQVRVEDPLLTFPGPIEFGEEGENTNAQPVVMQVQDGEVVQVFPEEFAQAEPQFPAVPWNGQ